MAAPRFAAKFNFLTERRLSLVELKRFEQKLKAGEPMVRRLYPSPYVGSGYIRSKQYVVLETWDLSDDWVSNRKHGHTIRKKVAPLMHAFGLHDEDNTIYDEAFDEIFAPERSVFQTSNMRRWETLLNWLRKVDPKRAGYIEKTRDWKVVYPPYIWAILEKAMAPARLDRLPAKSDLSK